MQRLLFFILALLINPIYSSQAIDDYQLMDEIALRSGADKGSNFHNYTEVYSKYFAPLRNKPIKFLEIGIYQGASVKMWEEYLPNAELHFIDITFDKVEYFSNRSQYHLCNQESSKELEHLIGKIGTGFDVILDDGGHTMKQQINSFMTLFPHVKSGGMYIVEDLHTSYWARHYGGGDSNSMINFLKKLIDDVNRVGAVTGRASHLAIPIDALRILTTYQKEIFSIHFYDSVAIILKR